MICNHGVAGSSPAAGTIRFKHLAQPTRLGFVFYGLRFNAFEVQGFSVCGAASISHLALRYFWHAATAIYV
jgi:hypothetical protein